MPVTFPLAPGTVAQASQGWGTSCNTGAAMNCDAGDVVIAFMHTYGDAATNISISGTSLGSMTKLKERVDSTSLFSTVSIWAKTSSGALTNDTITASWTTSCEGRLYVTVAKGALANLESLTPDTDFGTYSAAFTAQTSVDSTITAVRAGSGFVSLALWGAYPVPKSGTYIMYREILPGEAGATTIIAVEKDGILAGGTATWGVTNVSQDGLIAAVEILAADHGAPLVGWRA